MIFIDANGQTHSSYDSSYGRSYGVPTKYELELKERQRIASELKAFESKERERIVKELKSFESRERTRITSELRAFENKERERMVEVLKASEVEECDRNNKNCDEKVLQNDMPEKQRMTLDETIAGCLNAWRPIVYVCGVDFETIDDAIQRAIDKLGWGDVIEEYNHASGRVNFKTKEPCGVMDEVGTCSESCTMRLARYLDDYVGDCGIKRILVLRDVHGELGDPMIVARLKAIAWRLSKEKNEIQIIIVSSRKMIPLELDKYIAVFDHAVPKSKEIEQAIKDYMTKGGLGDLPQRDIDELILALRGLELSEISLVLNSVRQQTCNGTLSPNEATGLIIKEKRQIIQKSSLLEPVEVEYGEKDSEVGGLNSLIKYLKQKADVFQHLVEAINFGVSIPKGILLVGMPGCGKSLAAKECARLFKAPLIRLDIGRLLGRYVGESEENLRLALRHAEGAMPCVLWIDEIEKAFAGVGKDDSGVTTRLFGQFLTWMQEKDAKESTVYVVATANDLTGIPPEFLRRGRFDEIFRVDLPGIEERKAIFKIHLQRRLQQRKLNWQDLGIDVNVLANATGGYGESKYSGADIESIVKTAVEAAFVRHRKDGKSDLCQQDLLDAIKQTRPVCETMKDKIESLRKSLEKFQVLSALSEK